MRILELEIWRVRGIKHLIIKPAGKNFVIYGPNSSGKSAVVDALDFLLTGRITRLSGKGTGGLKMDVHGPHLDHKPTDAVVRAVIKLPGVEKPIEIRRCMATSSSLEYDQAFASQMEKTLSLTRHGQHVLTRKDILNYITAEPGTRAQQIQELLNITEVEKNRKLYVRAKSEIQSKLKTAQGEFNAARAAVSDTIHCATWSKEDVIKIINRCRLILGGHPISIVNWRELKNGLKPPGTFEDRSSADLGYLKKEIEYLCTVVQDSNQQIMGQFDQRIRNLIEQINADSNLAHSLSRIKLTELGITMVNDMGDCPLCGTAWPPGKLYDYLQDQLARVKALLDHEEIVKEVASAIADRATGVVSSLGKVISAIEGFNIDQEIHSVLSFWKNKLNNFLESLSEPVTYFSSYKPERVKRLLAPDNILETLQTIERAIQNNESASLSPQSAWDTLTRLEENLKAFGTAGKNLKYWGMCFNKANIMLEEYVSARDTVLGKLYLDIEERFVNLYRQLHGDDEEAFTAKIGPTDAGVTLGVNFHGRGFHPPHALHSEGHQDSMGICLYFALAERLTGDLLDLIILDDIVLSIDDEHRSKLCSLFAGSFPHRQLFITTHNKAWVEQLLNLNVVAPEDTVQLYDWNINIGPLVKQS